MLQIIVLAFIPIRNLDEVLDALAEHLPDTLIPLLDWFEDNYVGRPNRRGNVSTQYRGDQNNTVKFIIFWE
jgi:hypothetical protein